MRYDNFLNNVEIYNVTENHYDIFMRYYGGKSKLLDLINQGVSETGLKNNSVFLDAFSGTSVVGQFFKLQNHTIYSNDTLNFCYTLAKGLVGLNNQPKFKKFDKHPLEILNSSKGTNGFLTVNFSPFESSKRQYFSVKNAQKIDSINLKIHTWLSEGKINKNEFYYLKTSLLKAVNLVSNVSGTYGAFLKTWDARALKPIKLESFDIYNNGKKNKIYNDDINKLVKNIKTDIAYFDPPYNSRQYHSNYFILELISRGWFEKNYIPKGITGMVDFSDLKSAYSSKVEAFTNLESLVKNIDTKYILLSYNNEVIIETEAIKKLLKDKGRLKIIDKEHKRYRSINQDGSNIKTKEFLYVVKVD